MSDEDNLEKQLWDLVEDAETLLNGGAIDYDIWVIGLDGWLDRYRRLLKQRQHEPVDKES